MSLNIRPRFPAALTLLSLVSIFATSTSLAQAGRPPASEGPWRFTLGGGAAHQFDTDVDGGGSFAVNRLFIEPGVQYAPGRMFSASLTLGYGHDDYDFSGIKGFGGGAPWGGVNTFRVSAPLRYQVDDRWSVFAVPSVRTYYESSASASDGTTGGVLVAATYKFNENLSIGPGLGVFSQLEDSTMVFPVLAIRWQITDQLELSTGRGLAATVGPGLTLSWKHSEPLKFGLTGRLDKTRFRLDDKGNVPGGVGEDRSIGLFASVQYKLSPQATVSAFGGASFDGELRVEDDRGRGIYKEDYDTALSLGLTFRFAM